MKLFGIKISSDGLEWGEDPEWPDVYYYYFYWKPNWLEPKYRHLGILKMYYDTPHVAVGFWFFNISWSTQWSTYDWDR